MCCCVLGHYMSAFACLCVHPCIRMCVRVWVSVHACMSVMGKCLSRPNFPQSREGVAITMGVWLLHRGHGIHIEGWAISLSCTHRCQPRTFIHCEVPVLILLLRRSLGFRHLGLLFVSGEREKLSHESETDHQRKRRNIRKERERESEGGGVIHRRKRETTTEIETMAERSQNQDRAYHREKPNRASDLHREKRGGEVGEEEYGRERSYSELTCP